MGKRKSNDVASGGVRNTVILEPIKLTPAEAMKQERRRRRKMREVADLGYAEQVESLQRRYRARRIPRKQVAPEPSPELESVDLNFKAPKFACGLFFYRIAARLSPPSVASYDLTPEARRAVNALALTAGQVQTLMFRFQDIDVMKLGQVSKDDFWKRMEINPTAFTNKLFELVDTDNSGMLDFSEFVCVLVTFCVFNRDDILRFAFDCFDADGSGRIDHGEVEALVHMLQSQDPKYADNVAVAVGAIRDDSDGEITFEEFRALNAQFALMLQPAFALQDSLHTHTLGRAQWVQVMENLTHAEQDQQAMLTQFGRPVQSSILVEVAKLTGLARRHPRVDVNYINTMRPSKHIFLGYEDDAPLPQLFDMAPLPSIKASLGQKPQRLKSSADFNTALPSKKAESQREKGGVLTSRSSNSSGSGLLAIEDRGRYWGG